MRIDFGPPGHKGVTQIMGLGEVQVLSPVETQPCKTVAGLAVVTYIAGAVIGSNMTKNMAIGGLVALLVTRALKERALKTAINPQNTLQGWG